jgi:glycosyltransferase involved in cell wall biosynthesis
MKIAWLSPFRKYGSGIAQFSAAACDGLLRGGHEVIVFASDLGPADEPCRSNLPIVRLPDSDHETVIRSLDDFDLVAYNLGNHVDFHRSIYDLSRKHLGIVILHDLVMRDFFAGYFLCPDGSRLPELLEMMEYCHGPQAVGWLRDLAAGRVEAPWTDPRILEYHMAKAAVSHAHGVVVHSEFARARVAEFAGSPVAHIHFPAPDLAEEALSWGPPPAAESRPVRLLTLGHINLNKLVDLVIECMGASPTLRTGVAYTVVGAIGDLAYRDRLYELVERLGLGGVVRFAGPVSSESLREHIREADLIVNLRNPHYGESSWSMIEVLFAAKPTVVWNHGFYAEAPDWAVRKVASREELIASLEEMCREPGHRKYLGDQARRYAVETFDTEAYGRELVAFAKSIRHERIILDLADRVAHRVGEMGVDPAMPTMLDRVPGEIAMLAQHCSPRTLTAEGPCLQRSR